MAKRKDFRIELVDAVEFLIRNNIDVSARAVAKRLHIAPSSITRDNSRRNSLEAAQKEQARLRSILETDKSSRQALARRLAAKEAEIIELKRKLSILTASHRAMLTAIGTVGGTAAWIKFFRKFEHIRSELRELNAIPDGTQID